jgi:CheY-like chemotaxis protein
MLLTSVGYDVAIAENGVSAVSHLDRTVADLIVTDLNMPGMSGMELISHVRSRHPATLIVAMSGDYQGDSVPAGIIADRYYPKGQHPHNLLTAIASLIESQAGRVILRKPHSAGSGFLERGGNYDWNRLDRSVGVVSGRRAPDVEPQPFLGLFSQQRTGFDTGRRRGFAAAWPDLVERY